MCGLLICIATTGHVKMFSALLSMTLGAAISTDGLVLITVDGYMFLILYLSIVLLPFT